MSNHKKLTEKRLREDEATAHAFQEYIDTFQNVVPTGKSFIKSGIYKAGSSVEVEDDDDKGKLYNPLPLLKFPINDTNKKAIECARLVKETKHDRVKHNIKPKSNLELLKEELRLRHIDRDIKRKLLNKSEDANADPMDVTTNLFLTNLNPKLNEQDLMQIFGVYGPLASVKIMWPRLEDRSRNSNIGFVAFMSRKDSERAYSNLGTREDMKISWGKPIEIPTHPIYIPPELAKQMLPPPYSGLPFNAQPVNKNYTIPENEQEMKELLFDSIVKVTIPLDKKLLMVIHRVIEFVIREGPMFEAMMMHKEIKNPSFQFLFDNKSSTHAYYRWKLFSIMNGENPLKWSTKPFRMFKEGSIWIPPTVPDYTKGMLETQPSKSNAQSLSDNQQVRLIQSIQGLTLERSKIGEAMVFCLKHAEASKDVVNIISESFESVSTVPMKKICRLYLVSDILYNTKFKKAPLRSYQELFERKLKQIFENLEITHKSIPKSEDKLAFRSRILKVLRAWEIWKVYSSDLLDELETTILGDNCEDSCNDEPLDGNLLIARSLNYNPKCVVQPETSDVKEENKEEKDIFANFIHSKWDTLDPAEIESQAMSTQKLYDIEMARLENERKEKELTLERGLLRKVELKVVKFQDELLAGKRKIRKRNTLEEEVNEYRKKCIEKLKHETKLMETSPISTDSFSSEEDSRSNYRRKGKHTKSRKCRN